MPSAQPLLSMQSSTGKKSRCAGTMSTCVCMCVCVCVCVCVMRYEYMHARHACMEELGKGKGGMLALSCTWITRAKAACCTLITL